MSNLPPGLEDFGTRLTRAAAIEIEDRKRQRRRSRLRNLGLPVVAALTTAAVAAGAAKVVGGGEGDPIDRSNDAVGTNSQAAKDPAVVVASAVPDPSGGPPWVVRVYTNTTGRACVQAGRLRADGTFGLIQRGKFRALPSTVPGTCSGRERPLFATERRSEPARTLVYGLAPDGAAVTVHAGTTIKRARLAGLGAFVLVFAGTSRDPTVVVRTKDGKQSRVRLPG
jgi:hypothetical protein